MRKALGIGVKRKFVIKKEVSANVGTVIQSIDEKNNGSLHESETASVSKEVENEERGNWIGRFDFFLSCVGYAVGLGNVWRFPYLCFRNGGASFLIPYTIMLFIAGLPLFYFELALGQFGGLGPIKIWNISPFFRGIGYAACIITSLFCIYYNVIIAWSIYYLFASMKSVLPWKYCNNEWNDFQCQEIFKNNTNNLTKMNEFPLPCNGTTKFNCTNYESPSEQYWERVTLGVTEYDGHMLRLHEGVGAPQPYLILSLLLAWIIVFFCIINGIKSSGKVVYFTATFPYVLITALLIRGVTLPGSWIGIQFYLFPKWEKLLDARVWLDAASQIFYSLGVAGGGLMSMASYNKFKNNCYRDAMLVPIINCSTSFYAGFAIFSVLGFMSLKSGLPMEKVAKSGPGLAFVAYPEAISNMAVPQLWSVLFFIMLLLLGLDSQFVMVETVICSIMDLFPLLRKKYSLSFKILICGLGFLLGVPLCCKGGIYYFQLVDWYSSSWSLFTVAIFELAAVFYFYGFKKFMNDIKMMIGFYPGPYWIACWLVITPSAVLFIYIFSIIQYVPIFYGSYSFPAWAEALGFLICLCSIIFIPIFMIFQSIKSGGIRNAIKESEIWGPSVEKFWLESEYYTEKLNKRKQIESMQNIKHLEHFDER